jgi:hypothetical protein
MKVSCVKRETNHKEKLKSQNLEGVRKPKTGPKALFYSVGGKKKIEWLKYGGERSVPGHRNFESINLSLIFLRIYQSRSFGFRNWLVI